MTSLRQAGTIPPMNTYELTMIFPEAGEKEKIVKQVLEFVKKHKGEVVKQESWGVKTMTYMIKKQKTGDYEYLLMSLQPKDQPELAKTLSLTEGILRYLFVRV